AIGVWLGWILVITYLDGSILNPFMFGLFFDSFLNFFGLHAGYPTGVLGGLIPVIVVAYLTKKNIRISLRIVGYFMLVEASFVLLLSIYIMIKQAMAGHLSFRPFDPVAATAGWKGFLAAALFAVLAIAAFDVIAPM